MGVQRIFGRFFRWLLLYNLLRIWFIYDVSFLSCFCTFWVSFGFKLNRHFFIWKIPRNSTTWGSSKETWFEVKQSQEWGLDFILCLWVFLSFSHVNYFLIHTYKKKSRYSNSGLDSSFSPWKIYFLSQLTSSLTNEPKLKANILAFKFGWQIYRTMV
jgi:hypothetical protein